MPPCLVNRRCADTGLWIPAHSHTEPCRCARSVQADISATAFRPAGLVRSAAALARPVLQGSQQGNSAEVSGAWQHIRVGQNAGFYRLSPAAPVIGTECAMTRT